MVYRGRAWHAVFSDRNLRRFYVEYLLYHEVGHHHDWYQRRWSAANGRACEEAADQYAVVWSRTAKHVMNRIEKDRRSVAESPRRNSNGV